MDKWMGFIDWDGWMGCFGLSFGDIGTWRAEIVGQNTDIF